MGTVAVAGGHLKGYVWPSVSCGSTEVYKQDGTHWSLHKPSFHFRSSRRNQSFTPISAASSHDVLPSSLLGPAALGLWPFAGSPHHRLGWDVLSRPWWVEKCLCCGIIGTTQWRRCYNCVASQQKVAGWIPVARSRFLCLHGLCMWGKLGTLNKRYVWARVQVIVCLSMWLRCKLVTCPGCYPAFVWI